MKDFLFGAIEGYNCLQGKWRPERMKAAIEAMTKKVLTQYKVLTFVSLLQTAVKMKVTPVRFMKAQCSTVKYGQGSSNEAMKATLCRKQVLPDEVENYLTDDNIFSLTMTLCECLTLINGIKNQLSEKKKGLNDMVKKFFCHQEFRI